MIRINLSSTGGVVQSSFWFLFDLIVLAVVVVGGYFGVEYYINIAKESINIVNNETANMQSSLKKLEEITNRYNSLESDINALQSKINAIRVITVSVFEKYKPLIVLEHLQVLQPDGVWYHSLSIVDDKIKIKGSAFDNLMVANFLTALESTKVQEIDYTDFRTQVYFDQTKLLSTVSSSNRGKLVSSFEIDLTFKSKSSEKISNNEMAVINDF